MRRAPRAPGRATGATSAPGLRTSLRAALPAPSLPLSGALARGGLFAGLLALLAGCSGSGNGSTGEAPIPAPSAGAASTGDWSALSGGATPAAVVHFQNKPFLFAEIVVRSFGEPENEALRDLPEPPDCQDSESRGDAPCPISIPAPAAAARALPAMPATVTVIGPAGTCEAKVEPLAVVRSSGCEPSVTLAFPLVGCEGPVAPVALRGGTTAAKDLQWVPVVEGPVEELHAPDAPADPSHRMWALEWLSGAAPAPPGVPVEMRARRNVATAGEESVEVWMAARHVRLPECNDTVSDHNALWLRRGERWIPVTDSPDMVGIVRQGGRVALVVLDDSRFIGAWGRTGEETFKQVLQARHFRDNEECYGPRGVGYESDCAP